MYNEIIILPSKDSLPAHDTNLTSMEKLCDISLTFLRYAPTYIDGLIKYSQPLQYTGYSPKDDHTLRRLYGKLPHGIIPLYIRLDR